MTERAQLPVLQGGDLPRLARRRGENRDSAVLAEARLRDDAAPGGQGLDGAALSAHAADPDRPVVLHREHQRLSVRGPGRIRDGTIEPRREERRSAAARRHDGELGLVVGVELVDVVDQDGDARAVGAPVRPPHFALQGLCQLHRHGAAPGFDREEVLVLRPIGLGVGALAQKAIVLPSGDQAGSLSSAAPEVSMTRLFDARSKSPMCA